MPFHTIYLNFFTDRNAIFRNQTTVAPSIKTMLLGIPPCATLYKHRLVRFYITTCKKKSLPRISFCKTYSRSRVFLNSFTFDTIGVHY